MVKSSLPDPVRQFSIFTENKVGRLRDITRLFGEQQIHVVALTTLDTTDSAIVRVVVDDPDKARILLGEHAIAFSESIIVAVEIASERDLEKVLSAILEAEINIHYLYSFLIRPMGRSALAMSIEDREFAIELLNRTNHKVLGQSDISR